MARQSIFKRPRLYVGIAVFVLVFFLIFSFQSLPISDPFFDEFNFLTISNSFSLLDVTGFQINLADHIKSTNELGTEFNYFGRTKLNTVVQFADGGTIDLNSRFQSFSPLFGLELTSTSGREITSFTTEPRMTLDVILALDDTRLDYRVRSSNLAIDVRASDENGVMRDISTNNPIGLPVVEFTDSRQPDPIREGKELFIGSERAVGKPFTINADSIERVLSPTKSYNSRVEFRLHGTFTVEIPWFQTTGVTSEPLRVNIPVDQLSLVNAMDLKVNKASGDAVEVPSETELTVKINSVQPNIVRVSGDSSRSELVRVFSTLNNVGQTENPPTCTARQTQLFTQSSVVVASSDSFLVSSSGIDSQYECRLRIPENLDAGTYYVRVETNASNRAGATGSFEIIVEGVPTDEQGNPDPTKKICFDCLNRNIREVGVDDMCPVFQCNDGTTTGEGQVTCEDGLPADRTTDGKWTCIREETPTGQTGLPQFIECVEGQTADVAKGEICVPPFLGFLVNNLLVIGIGLFLFIILIAVIAKAMSSGTKLNVRGL